MKFLKESQNVYALIALMSIFVLFKIRVPRTLAAMIDSSVGKMVVIAVAVMLVFVNPVLGSVALITAYELINRSEQMTGTYHMRKFLPSEVNKVKVMDAYNVEHEKTLEEEMVDKMIPLTQHHNIGPAEYKPTLEKLHNAARV
jgi:hypothetical protein